MRSVRCGCRKCRERRFVPPRSKRSDEARTGSIGTIAPRARRATSAASVFPRSSEATAVSLTAAKCPTSKEPRASGNGSRERAMPIRAATGSSIDSFEIGNESPDFGHALDETAFRRPANNGQVSRHRVDRPIQKVAFHRRERPVQSCDARFSEERCGKGESHRAIAARSQRRLRYRGDGRGGLRAVRSASACGVGIEGAKRRSATAAPRSELRVSRTPFATTQAAPIGNEERASKRTCRNRLAPAVTVRSSNAAAKLSHLT